MSFLDNLYNNNEVKQDGILPWVSRPLDSPIETIRKQREQKTEELSQPTRLHAPYNVIVEPTRDKDNKTQTGGDYDQAMKKFKELTAQNDLTQEAADIRQAWSVPPRVSIENGQIKLSGTQQFLNSDTARQLREVFAEMKGQTYNTEALDKQIEAWNSDLENMGKSYIEALDGLNAMNYSIYTTHKNPTVTMLTFEDYLRIVNNAAIGRDKDALTSDKLIFMGYEWNEDGTKTPIYKKASEFVADVAALKGPKGHSKDLIEAWNNRSADSLKSGQSIYWNELAAQAAEGDVSAIAKMAFLQGDSEAAPANVIVPDKYRFNDFVSTTMMSLLNGLSVGADVMTAWYNPITGLPRLANNLFNVAKDQDWDSFWKSDDITKQTRDFSEVVGWYNAYNSQLMPGSTAIGATIGTAGGMALAIEMNLFSAFIAHDVMMKGAKTAFTAAGNWLESHNLGTRITATLGSTVGNAQTLVTMRNAPLVTNVGQGFAKGAQAGITQFSIVLPKFLVENPNMQGFAKAIVETAFRIEAALQGGNLAGKAGSDLGLYVMNGNEAFKTLFGTTMSTLPALKSATTATATIFKLGKTELDLMRNWSRGFQVALNLAAAGNHSVLRHADTYLRRQYAGEDMSELGDMATYVGLNLATDIAIAGAYGIGGSIFKHIKEVSNATRVAPTRVVDVITPMSNNRVSGFYTPDPVLSSGASTSTVDVSDLYDGYTELSTLFGSIMTTNGERFFVPNDVADIFAVPDSLNAGVSTGLVNATGAVKNYKLTRSTIVPAVDGFNIVTFTRDINTGEETTDISFYNNFDEANNALQKTGVPIMNPKTLANSDLAVGSNVAPFDFGGEQGSISAIRTLPDGTSRIKVNPGYAYYTPSEFSERLEDIVSAMSPEVKMVYSQELAIGDGELIQIGQNMAIASALRPAPDFSRVPQTAEEAKVFAGQVNQALGYAKFAEQDGKSVLIPTRIPATSTETAKVRRMTTDRIFYAQPMTEYQAPEEDTAGNWRKDSGEYNDYAHSNNAIVYALGEQPKTIDPYSMGNKGYSQNKTVKDITGKDYNTAAILRRQVGKKTYDLASAMAALWALWDIGYFHDASKFINGAGVVSKTTAKNFIASLYGGDGQFHFDRETLWGTREEVLGHHDIPGNFFGESANWDLFNHDDDLLRHLDNTPGGVGEQSYRHYFYTAKGEGVLVVWMSPDDYFTILKQEQGIDDNFINNLDTTYYQTKIKNGEKLSVPYITFMGKNGAYDGQEGRHRILAAKKEGFSRVPVIIKYRVDNAPGYDNSIYDKLTSYGIRFGDITSFVGDMITALSPVVNNGETLDSRIEKKLDETLRSAENAISGYFRVFETDESKIAGLDEFFNIVYKHKKELIELLKNRDKNVYNTLYRKVARRAKNNVADGVRAAIKKTGADTKADFRMLGHVDMLTGIAHLYTDKEGLTGDIDSDDIQIIHVPRGTKVGRVDHDYYPTDIDVRNSISDHYVVDVSNVGYRSESSSDAVGYDEVWINKPNGSPHKEIAFEFTPDNMAIYGYGSNKDYTGLLGKLFKPLHKKTYLHDIYKTVMPGGDINARTNPKLRYNSSLGTLPVTSLVSFVGDIIDAWDNPANYDNYNGKLPMVEAYAILNRELYWLKSNYRPLYDSIMESGDSTFLKALNPIKEYLEETITDAEEAGITYNPGGYMDYDVLNSMKKDLIEAALATNDKHPQGLGRDMEAVKKMEGDASHVSLAPWVAQRGMASGGNDISKWSRVNVNDFTTDLSTLKPGDDYVDEGFAFASLNPLVPFGYTDGKGDKYIIRYIGQKGTKVYYFGDTENFTDRLHQGDGGAIMIPRNTHGVVTSVQKVGKFPKDVTIIYVALDGEDGPYTGPIDKESSVSVEETKKRRTVEVTKEKPNKYLITENGVTKASFSDIQAALEYKNAKPGRQIYELDDNAPVMDRPPVTMDNVYTPTLRSDSARGVMPIEQPEGAPDITVQIEKFNDLMLAMPLLKDSPTDYAQGILDIARIVQEVYDAIAATVDMPAIYEEYARQIAEGVEQPTVDDETKEKLAPLTEILNALGRYFDPSGKSLTQEFYLPTGAPSKKLASIEDAILHPDRAVDVEHPVDTSFDDIMVDPLRVGDSGFWEKRTGELFRDEDGNFTMAKAGTLEENLIAYTVAALTRGEYALSVAANNEVAYSKFDRNRNQITVSEALKGLRGADKNRAKIRASQIKAAKSYSRREKKAKLEELKNGYSDENTIKAIEEAYGERNFAKEINYTRTLNKNARILGYRRTLNISPIKGSALRFGNNNGFKGIANDIRKASHITVTGTKWVTRYGEKVCVAFGLSPAQMEQTEATRHEDAINLGNSAMLLFQPERAAGMFYKQILKASETWATQGGFELINAIKDFARSNFPALSNPEAAADKLFQSMVSNFNAYSDETALWLANQETITEWIKKYAAVHINSIIQMADIDALDERTIDAIDQIMTKALVGTAVYSSKIVSALQRSTYAATLWVNPSPMVGNMLSEPSRGIDFFGYKVFAKAVVQFLSPKARAQAKNELGDLETYLKNEPELVGLAKTVKNKLQVAFEALENKAMSPLQKSENQKNLLFWLMAKENAARMYPKDKSAQLQNALRTFNDIAIAGGPGTTPGVASSNIGRLVFVLKTFSLRNWDDFIEIVEQIGHGSSGSYKWDKGLGRRAQGGYGGGEEKFDYKKAGRFMGGTLLRRYLLWLFVLGPLGRSIWDALGGDPTGLTENFSRGLYDDESTEEYEGMTPLDNLINMLPTGFIFGMLKDFYFAARRSGVETGNFLGPIDIERDAALQKDLRNHLPLGVMNRRIGDMMELLDRGYSFNSYGNKTYAAPQNILDIIKGFALGKSTTSNAMAYNKYRYGSVDIWGDLFEGDWLDFAMSANPFADDLGLVKFDSTRKDYNGVFRGSYNDVPTMQAAIADLRNRRGAIVQEYNQDLERYTGPFQGLNDQQRKDLAAKRREAKISTFTEDVQRLVDAYTKAGNALSDSQVNTLMYLFDFNEGDEDTYDSQVARQRYVEAGLPDVNPAIQPAKQDSETGEITEPNYFQRSLIYQNAVQGRYGVPREAAKAVDEVLSNFKSTYKSYKEKVTNLNNKAYAAAKNSKERKNLQAEVEKLQEEYLNQLYSALTPVVNKYGTEVLSSNAVVESLQPYMSSMIPYSTIKKYGLTYSSGNDIVWGQLADWIKGRWGAGSPTVGSDPEITAGIKTIKALLDEGKTAQAKSQARALLDRVARGSLSARHDDVVELRRIISE